MPLWNPSPPQGESSAQGLYIIGKPLSPKYGAPQGIAEVVPQKFLLDLFPNAELAYSLRQLRTDYLGPAIRVRRTSDLTTQDIGFLANGDLDVTSLETFVGANDGEISIIYDQSGNGIDLDDISTADRPKIIIAGELQTSNNFPAIDFDGLNDFILSTNSLPTPASHLFVFGVWEKTILEPDNAVFNLQTPNENPDRVSAFAPFRDGRIIWEPGNNTTENLETAASFNDFLQHQYTFTKTAGTNRQIIRRDGIELAAKTQVSSSTILNRVALGSLGSVTSSAAMLWQELVFYDTDRFSDIIPIETNLDDYWMALSKWIDDLNNIFVTDEGKNLVFVP